MELRLGFAATKMTQFGAGLGLKSPRAGRVLFVISRVTGLGNAGRKCRQDENAPEFCKLQRMAIVASGL
jgi:hypothetical protein